MPLRKAKFRLKEETAVIWGLLDLLWLRWTKYGKRLKRVFGAGML
jgi:hypothetical protein